MPSLCSLQATRSSSRRLKTRSWRRSRLRREISWKTRVRFRFSTRQRHYPMRFQRNRRCSVAWPPTVLLGNKSYPLGNRLLRKLSTRLSSPGRATSPWLPTDRCCSSPPPIFPTSIPCTNTRWLGSLISSTSPSMKGKSMLLCIECTCVSVSEALSFFYALFAD